jgi:hypothetical protein
MKIQEEVLRKFVADNGAVFDTEEECYKYEMGLVQSTVQESTKYVIGYILPDGSGYFQKYKRYQWKNGSVKWTNMGGTSNVKYAYKFNSFEEAYGIGRNEVMTLEDAKKASEVSTAKNKKKKEVEQRYVKVLCEDKGPNENGIYITNVGEVEFYDGWASTKTVKFWMKKVNLTAR